jgi:ubiquinone biosynthesis protein
MLLEHLTRTESNARRLAEITALLVKYGLADLLANMRHMEWFRKHLTTKHFEELTNVTHEARIRLVLTELGTTFIKFGQVLSTRPDIVGMPLADELTKLQTATPADPPEVVAALIQEELGRSPAEVFAHFDPVPLASASIGQVHAATLHTGEDVVVKVQHIGIQEQAKRDLDLLQGLAELAEKHVESLRSYRPVAVVRQFARALARELDFTAERLNLEQFTRHFAQESGIHFPVPYAELSTKRILTMQRLYGVRGDNPDAIQAQGVDPADLAMNAAMMYLQMIFQDGFYHADPHPGNYLVMEGGVLGVFDAGMVGNLDDELRDQLEALIIAVYHRDVSELTDVVLQIGANPPGDMAPLRSEIADFMHDFANQPLQQLDLSAALNRMIDIIRRFGIILPAEVALLLRTLVVLEGSARQMNSQFSLAQVIDTYVRSHRAERFLRRIKRRTMRATRDWERLLSQLPGELTEIIKRFREGKLDIHHEHRGMEKSVNRLVRGLLTAALTVASAQLWSNKTPPLAWDTSIVGVAGFTFATFMAYRLLRSTKE